MTRKPSAKATAARHKLVDCLTREYLNERGVPRIGALTDAKYVVDGLEDCEVYSLLSKRGYIYQSRWQRWNKPWAKSQQ